MNKEYKRPTLTVYGDIEELTQATGGAGSDVVIIGITSVVDGVTTTTNITSIGIPGSGTRIFGR